ncbi:MAG: hypothetical protein ACYDH9_25855 [Limisphaerales bacterium]
MKLRLAILSLALASAFGGYAQTAASPVSITATDMYANLGWYYYAYGNAFDPLNPATSFPCTGLMGTTNGPQLWDFSKGPTNVVYRYDYVPATNAPPDVLAIFPAQATMAEQQTVVGTNVAVTVISANPPASDANTSWTFFQQEPGVGRRVYGFYDPYSANQNFAESPAVVFPQAFIDWPDTIRFGDAWTASYTVTTTNDLIGSPLAMQQVYSSSFTVDAFGTIDLPASIGFLDALRVNETQTIDTYIDSGFGTGGGWTLQETDYAVNYYWLSPGHGVVAQLDSTQLGSPTPNFDQATAFIRMFATNHKPSTGGTTTGPSPVTDLSIAYSSNNGQVLLKWTAPSGTRQFQVQYTTGAFDAASWQSLASLTNVAYVLDNTKADQQRFYRVVSVK